ncbi:DoxX-like family protein [Chitinophaga sp. CF118]|uniref:DoxX-like family protein n=1 Tax=Chitinophaga sp. CF118 TaxID=1884367 RepID=UPI0008E3E112|nr:DoxX-like family protein [Chitinophaga sp. CF118]SFF01842.1 DoxX-like family protein [Chitinophaga sp. CF118]
MKVWRVVINVGISLVWLINGLFCKVLNLVPRHKMIVTRILGDDYTVAIGILEILMAVWILTRIKSRLCAVTQMLVVAIMNILEFILVPDLLLFGHFNIVVASCFILVIFLNEFISDAKLP